MSGGIFKDVEGGENDANIPYFEAAQNMPYVSVHFA